MRKRGRRAVASALLVASVVVAGCTSDIGAGSMSSSTTTATTPTTTTPTTTTPTTATTATTATTEAIGSPSALVDTLAIRPADATWPTYERDRFGGDWDYDPASGCNTRERVLIEESLTPPQVDDRCRSTDGRWRSLYDDVETTDPADLQIDHFIPLADAWRSGAASWTDERRLSLANDLTMPETLIGVTGRTNQSKGDSTPDQWLPPDRTSWCRYATAWVQVKARWELSVTPAEKVTLVQVLSGC